MTENIDIKTISLPNSVEIAGFFTKSVSSDKKEEKSVNDNDFLFKSNQDQIFNAVPAKRANEFVFGLNNDDEKFVFGTKKKNNPFSGSTSGNSFIDNIRERNLSPVQKRDFSPTNKARPVFTPLSEHNAIFARNTTITNKIETYVGGLSIESGKFTNLKFSQLFPQAQELPNGNEIGDTLLNIGTATFLQSNKDLVGLFNDNPELLSQLASPEVKNENDVKQIVVDFVSGKLNSNRTITNDVLKNNFLLTKFAAFDLGGIIGILNNDSSSQKAFAADETFGLKQIEEDIFEKASRLFPGNSVFSRSFFRKNPTAAVHFLSNTGQANVIRNSTNNGNSSNFVFNNGNNGNGNNGNGQGNGIDNANGSGNGNGQGNAIGLGNGNGQGNAFGLNNFTSANNKDGDVLFTSRISSNLKNIKSEAVNFAFNQFNTSPVLNKTFLNSNNSFRNAAIGSEFTDKEDSLIDFVNNNKELTRITDKAVDIKKIYTSFQAEKATKKLPKGFAINKEFLNENSNLAFLINTSPKFTKALIKDEENVEKFVELNSTKKKELNVTRKEALTKVTGAVTSFLNTFSTDANKKAGVNVDLTA